MLVSISPISISPIAILIAILILPVMPLTFLIAPSFLNLALLIFSTLLVGTLLTFAHSLGEFGATVMVSGNLRLRTQTAPLYIFAQFEAGKVAQANAVAAVLAALSFVIFFFLLRYSGKAERVV